MELSRHLATIITQELDVLKGRRVCEDICVVFNEVFIDIVAVV